MIPRNKFPISIVVLVVAASVFGFATGYVIITSRQSAQNPILVLPTSSLVHLSEGSPAPEFSLSTLDGKSVNLKDFRGKRVLINFWASWCPPCLQEMPDLKAAYDALHGAGVVFLGVGTQDETANLKKFVDDNAVPYSVVEDPQGKVGDLYGVIGLPTTVLVDSNGIVRKVFSGPVTEHQVVSELQKMG